MKPGRSWIQAVSGGLIALTLALGLATGAEARATAESTGTTRAQEARYFENSAGGYLYVAARDANGPLEAVSYDAATAS